MLKEIIKQSIKRLGYTVAKRDRLVESIPTDYMSSPFLPKIYRGALHRYLYFKDMVDMTRNVPGNIVECGVSIGHGALLFLLLSEYAEISREYYGFDSFEGFPNPSEKDEKTPITGKGFWANPTDTVIKVLKDGRLPDEVIESKVHLIKGYFENTLTSYSGAIAILHLDCDLYDSYKVSLEHLYDKVSPGGVIMFDEYNDNRWPGATKAIDEFFRDKPESLQAHEKCDWKYFVIKGLQKH
jgi:hypothetical protein